MLEAPIREENDNSGFYPTREATPSTVYGSAPIRNDSGNTGSYPAREERGIVNRAIVLLPASNAQAYQSTALALPDLTNGPVSRIDPNWSPFQTLADVFLNTFSGGYQQPTQPTGIVAVEPDTGTSGTGLVILLLAAAGFAVYWFYFRKG